MSMSCVRIYSKNKYSWWNCLCYFEYLNYLIEYEDERFLWADCDGIGAGVTLNDPLVNAAGISTSGFEPPNARIFSFRDN